MNRFVIACHGWSASNYVSYVLNQHPSISCAHSSAAILSNDKSIFDGDGLKKSIPALRSGYLKRISESIDCRYDALEKEVGTIESGSNCFLGTVHTYRMRDLPEQLINHEIKYIYPVWNLVRNPFDLVISGYGQFLDLFQIDINEYAWSLNKLVRVEGAIQAVEKAASLGGKAPGDYQIICFASACAVLGSLELDIKAINEISGNGKIPFDYRGIIRMEDIIGNDNGFSEFISDLSGGNIFSTEEYRKKIRGIGKINRHHRSAPDGSAKRWEQLSIWQKELFIYFFSHFELRGFYESIGYDFSFLDAGA
ncbi:hypothetical protein [Larsenimonas rhizosphaerae]|uniref:hypothetical protein n=1 Tax=Larsenimonas rhizosphaerae TaxID=2944682 RepID=UPI002034A4A8|nr:hypothetical protein [Larsenimonas rhizosphaerae]MCM2131849.1 hypothetical protein [Larsenimonas rhizosphaerae]